MEVKFRYTRGESVRVNLLLAANMMRRDRRMRKAYIILLLLSALVRDRFSPGGLVFSAIWLFFVVYGFFLLKLAWIRVQNRPPESGGADWGLSVKDGWIVFMRYNTAGRRAEKIQTVKNKGGFLWIEIDNGSAEPIIDLIPERVFESKAALTVFKEYLLAQGNTEPVTPDVVTPDVVTPDVYGHADMTFAVGQKDIAHMWSESVQVLFSDLMGGQMHKKQLAAMLIYFIATLGIGCGLLRWDERGLLILGASAVFGVILLILLRVGTLKPANATAMMKLLEKSNSFYEYWGKVALTASGQGISFATEKMVLEIPWKNMRYVVETKTWLLFYNHKQIFCFYIPKQEAAEQLDLAMWLNNCVQNGLIHIPTDINRPRIGESNEQEQVLARNYKKSSRKEFVVYMGIVLVILVAITLWQSPGFRDPGRSSTQIITTYYEDSVPLATQIERLEAAGITVPADIVEAMEQQMEEYPDSREWIEGNPYVSLLSWLGYPEVDYDTWEVTTFPEQMYWFDFEGFDIAQDYQNMILGIDALAGDAVQITDITFADSRVNWEHGSGKLDISFSLNGRACSYGARVEHDWLDEGIFSYVNQQLAAAGITERIYLAGDGGQGAIIFYCNQDWADQFEAETGLPLYAD